MPETTEPNPYSPTTVENIPLARTRPANTVSTVLVGLNVYGGIVLAGAVFGAGVGLFAALSGAPASGEVFLILAALFLVGGLWAGVVGGPLVIVVVTTLHLVTRLTRCWTPRSLRLVAGSLGVTAGFISWAVPAVLVDGGFIVLVAFVPATVGGVGCGLMIEPMVRMARRHAALQQADADEKEGAEQNPFLMTDDASVLNGGFKRRF